MATKIRPRTRYWLAVATVALLAGSLTWVFGSTTTRPAAATGTPDIALTATGPARVLIGEDAGYTLTACNPHVTDGYNLSFRAVVPNGASLVSSSPAVTTQLTGQPTSNDRTLIWTNVTDLLAGACSSVSFVLGTDSDSDVATLPVGSTLTVTAGAYVNDNAFFIPDFNATTGVPVTGANSYTGSATATANTTLAAFTVTKTPGENGEGELTRGVHGADPKLWTLTVTNNPKRATNSFAVVDVLPPGLEFLGCASYYPADNTTNYPPTGTTEEYIGSGPMQTASSSATCIAPSTVETLTSPTVLADSTTAPIGSTRVTWSNAGDLAANGVLTITYLAGIPMFANAPFPGAAPTNESLNQGRNLDNNTGAATSETDTEQSLTNRVAASGTYQGPSTSGSNPRITDTNTGTVTAEDLLIRKSSSGTVVQGTVVHNTLVIETGEYRDVQDIVVTDTLPDGQCPLGNKASGGAASDCTAGSNPTIDTGSGAVSAPYTSAVENNDGTWTLVWDFSTVGSLAAMAHDHQITITFDSRVRTTYRENLSNAAPVLSGDSMTNNVSISAPDYKRTDKTIDDPENDGEIDNDVSSASIDGSWSTIDKRVSVRTGPLADNAGLTDLSIGDICADGTVTWAQGDPTPVTGYTPGDYVCFDLQADFPANLDYAGVRLFDYLPNGYTYVTNSERRVSAFAPDTLSGTTIASSTSSSIVFEVNGDNTVSNPGHTFHWTFAAKVGPPSAGVAQDIKTNQWKLAEHNTAMEVFQLRDYAGAVWTEPQLTLTKGVQSVSGSTNTTVAGPLPANTDNRTVERNDTVTYRIDIPNSGNVSAEQVEVWDNLPPGYTCADISNISDGGVCSPGTGTRIVWASGLDISIAAGNTKTLTFDMVIHSDESPGESIYNTAGVRSYVALTNAATPYTYYPSSNIDNTVTANTGPAKDDTPVVLPNFTVAKTQQSLLGETGNNQNASSLSTAEEATIGEGLQYKIVVTIPEGTESHDAVITDVVSSKYTYVSSSFTSSNPTLDTSVLDASSTGGSTTVTLTLPTPYVNAENSGDDTVTILIDVTVADIIGNARGTSITNAASLTSKTAESVSLSAVTSNTVTNVVVEPNLQITKADDIATGVKGQPGSTVNYTLTITNPVSGATVSTAHDAYITDLVPPGLTVVNGSTPVLDGGTVNSNGGIWNAALRTITWNSSAIAALDSINPGATAITAQYAALIDDPAAAGSVLTNTATVRATSLPGVVSGERTTYSASAQNTINLDTVSVNKSADRSTATIGDPVNYTGTITIPAGLKAWDLTVTDILPNGMVFDGYGTITLTPGSNGACPSVSGASTITQVLNGNGTTSLGWWFGDYTAPAAGSCSIQVTYSAHVAAAYANNSAVVRGNTLVNSLKAFWDLTDNIVTPPSTPPTTGYDTSAGPVTTTVTVIEPTITIDKDVSETSCDHTAGNTSDNDNCTTVPGSTYTYTLTIKNTGNSPAYNLTVTDQPDGQVDTVVPGTTVGVTLADGWTALDPAMSWTIDGPIAANGSVTITYTAAIEASASLHDTDHLINTADVPTYYGVDAATRSSHPSITYRTYGNDPSGPGGNVTADTVDMTLLTPNVTIAKTAVSDATDARIGSPFTWQIVATNGTAGTVAPAYNVDIDDTLPSGWLYVNGSARVTTPYGTNVAVEPTCAPSCTTTALSWSNLVSGNGQPLNAAATITITFDATPQASLQTVGTTGTFDHVNTASVAAAEDKTGATGNADGAYHGGPSTASARIRRIDLSVTKTVPAGPHYYGALVDWTIGINNAGPDTATSVTLDDVLPAGLLYDTTVSVSQGSFSSGTNRWTVGSMASSATVQLVVRTRINGTGTIVNTAEVRHADQWDVDSFPSDTAGSNGSEDDIASAQISPVVSSLGDLVWFDTNGDHVRDVAEPGIPNVDVILESAGRDATFGTADDFWGPNGTAGGGDDITTTTTATNASGVYGFVGLPAGQYRVRVDSATLPGGLTPTYNDDATSGVNLDHRSSTITLGSPATYLNADFGYTGTGSIGDQVWYDRDNSGTATVDPGETGFGNVAVSVMWSGFDNDLSTAADNITYSTTTNSSGVYGVSLLPAGNYGVTVDPSAIPTGLRTPTYDLDATTSASTVSTTLTAGQNRTDVDFSYTGTSSLGDKVWLDMNADGVQDPGEPGIASIPVTLIWGGPDDDVSTTGDNLTFTTSTDSTGDYLFDHLPPGSFRVTLTSGNLPAGLTPTYDLDGTGTAHVVATTLSDGQHRTDVDFGYAGVASLGDTVWYDVDNSGDTTQGPDEPGIANVQVNVTWAGPDNLLSTAADNVTFTATTDADGVYVADNLPYGDYDLAVVEADLPDGMTATYDLDGIVSASITTTSVAADDLGTEEVDEANRRDVDFSYTGTGSIGDLVWEDEDADGTVDDTEAGIEAVTLQVTWAGPDGTIGNADDVTVMTTTDADGIYGVGNLPAGNYRVAVDSTTVPTGMVAVYDLDGGSTADGDGVALAPLSEGEDRTDVDFGYQIVADLAITKTHTDAFAVGAIGTYTINVRNNGPATSVSPIVVTDTLPVGLTYNSATGAACAANGQTVTCTLPSDLENGASASYTMGVNVSKEAAPSVINVVTVTGPTVDRDPTNNRAEDPTEIPLADLKLTKKLDGALVVGKTADYVLTLVNAGPSVASGPVQVIDDLPEGLTFVSGTGDGWTCSAPTSAVTCTHTADLAVGTYTIRLQTAVAATVGATLVNHASVKGATKSTDYHGGIGKSFFVDPDPTSDTAVEGAQVEAPTLPRTGQNLSRMLLTAVGLIVAGGLLAGSARRRRLA
ncbi:MAG: SdrD B-like domain-containing protein [Acidimicrobiia bacterium]